MSVLSTSTNAYTHAICGRCWQTIYCSTAVPWDVTGYGICLHAEVMDAASGVVFTDYPDDPEMTHRCADGEMRTWLA